MEEEKKQNFLWKELGYLLLKIGFLAVVILIMFTCFFGIFRADDNSMKPAVKDGDLVITWRIQKNYQAGDVIVLENGGKKEIRRVIAVANDTVDFTEEGMALNGYLQQENEIYSETLPYVDGAVFPLTVEEGEVFVLADERENAMDSRIYGTIDIDKTYGKVMTIIRQRGI
ncbi:MAG: signal peptidase I [Bariatricus sp.]|nr:signal peptidase I [Bariatricus sp.]